MALEYFFHYSLQFQVEKFEFKVTVHYGLWVKCTQLWLLKYRDSIKFNNREKYFPLVYFHKLEVYTSR